MARSPSNKQVVAIPAIGEVWAGHEVRLGTADDADTDVAHVAQEHGTRR